MELHAASPGRIRSMPAMPSSTSHPRRLHIAVAVVIFCGSLLPGVSAGEDGHDHGDETPAAHTAPASPRFAAHSEEFELVGVLDDKVLTLYLDRADTNAPVEKARLELEIGGTVTPATESAPGEYRVTLGQPLKPGVTPITATITAEGASDLLAGELDTHEEGDEPAPQQGSSRWITLLAGSGGLAVIIAAGWWIKRRIARKRSDEGKKS